MADFDIVRGSSETLNCLLRDQDGQLINTGGLNGGVITLYANTSLKATAPTISLTMTTVGNDSQGLVTRAFVPADTISLTPGLYYAEVQITYTGVYLSGTKYVTSQPFTIGIMERVFTP